MRKKYLIESNIVNISEYNGGIDEWNIKNNEKKNIRIFCQIFHIPSPKDGTIFLLVSIKFFS